MRSAHYITTLKTTRLPERCYALDTEARIDKVAGMFHHKWTTGALCPFTGEPGGVYALGSPRSYATPDELWDRITAAAAKYGEVVVWAHNLPYDLRISDALRTLTRHGWELEAINLARTSAWASWKHKGLSLLLCDSMSWLPVGLDRIADDLGLFRRAFDYHRASADDLENRCRQDAFTLADAMSRALTFLDREDLGSFRPTGSAQSHVAWRRRFMPERGVLAHANADALVAERTAMHTGRAEAWLWGDVQHALYEFDMNLAYCRIAAEHLLPVRLHSERFGPTVAEYRKLCEHWAVLAEVTVTVDEPIVPVTIDERIMWPVGTFSTVLWEPELTLALARGAKVKLGRCWLYTRGDALMDMSRWLIEQLDPEADGVEPVVKRMLKHWARTLVGRCALRYRQWEYYGEHPHSDLCISHEYDLETGDYQQHLRIGHKMLELAELQESTSSVPQIPGWVMSKCRANLWEIMDVAGLHNVAYVDTDGLLVNRDGARLLRKCDTLPAEVVLKHKGTHASALIYGPRNVVLDDERRLSGIPKKAVQLSDIEFDGEVWSGMESALENERTDSVDVSRRRWEVTPSDHRRIHLDDGTTQPHRMENDA